MFLHVPGPSSTLSAAGLGGSVLQGRGPFVPRWQRDMVPGSDEDRGGGCKRVPGFPGAGVSA